MCNVSKLTKIGFLASRTISAESVLKCYDWATEITKQEGCVISGFNSKLEKDVLFFLLKGKQRVIVVLGRAMYKKAPKEWIEPINSGRLQIISISNCSRQTKETARMRNEYIISLADELVFASLNEQSSLYPLYQQTKILNKPILLL